jgi:hypothetical protein
VFPWEEHVVPAVPLVGAEHWTVALVRDPPMDIDFDPARSSYDAYLASLRRD